MKRTLRLAAIKKVATPHTLRHSFATHSYENGCDIRRIQKLMGHVRLETTTIYVKVARPDDESRLTSPLDDLYRSRQPASGGRPQKPVGKLRFHFKPDAEATRTRRARVTIEVETPDRPVYFTGTRITESRPGYVTPDIPPLEQWNEPLKWLSASQRSRFEEAEFYESLEREITSRFCRPHPQPS